MNLRTSPLQLWLCCLAFIFGLSACMQLEAPDQTNTNQNPEGPYCGASSTKAYTGAITNVSGNAKFEYRPLSLSGGCTGLCGDPTANRLNIPYAEVNILDASGNILQCGETDASGNFSNLKIPAVAGTYTVKVNSRSYTNALRASVLEDVYSAIPYGITKSFTIADGTTSASGINLVASAQASVSSKVPGGAFNILADIYWANQFLRAQTGNASFVADKVSVFWKAGFNPYSYYGAPNSLASFYVSSEDRLYILGGKNGDVKASDTDHFDDSVILHEYGHFLEAHYGHSDSPGGSHNGDFIIDPRLAWSEGWANYFQGAVLDSVVYATGGGPKGSSGFEKYVDTVGFKTDPVEGGGGTSAGIAINRSLTESAATATYDKPSTNEGLFREFSISRTLFKTFRAPISFSTVWEAFTSLKSASGDSFPHRFVNFGLFNLRLNTKITDPTQNTAWQAILTEEKQKRDTTLYGNILVPTANGGSCPTVTMNAVMDTNYPATGSPRSNQLMSNDFYTFYYSGQYPSISLSYTTGTGGLYTDLNLYLYSEAYTYAEEIQEATAGYTNSSLVKSSKTYNVSNSSETETISLSGLPAGYYMIVVKAATLNRSSASLAGSAAYSLSTAGGATCLVPN